MAPLFFLSALLFITVGWTAAVPTACNNSPDLCSQPYDMVTHLGAHDSPFLHNPSTQFSSFGNQCFNTLSQLDAGVRLLSTQVHVAANEQTGKRELHVCHTSCALFDAGALRDWLLEVRLWMDRNPNEVVTLLMVNMDGVDARELEGVYSEADIAHYGYVPLDIFKAPAPTTEKGSFWPTLGEMIESGQRLVTFVNPLKPDMENAPYLLDEFTFVWENNYETIDPSAFDCNPHRPSNNSTIEDMTSSGRLFLMNHFLYWQQAFQGIQVPDIRNINMTNGWQGPGALGEHMVRCGNELMRQPTFVLVDFFHVGPALDTIDIFNAVSHPVGRSEVMQELMDEHSQSLGVKPSVCLLLWLVVVVGVWNPLG
ncbi:hypothetical protein M011DRAFT_398712 [Sporormia fimetaria CBS 119925]|uniref:PLC-like phosphodiesterase n=1 Tax=Sporormia fimetaria CBS 119925 TaxID=1340428 RepID=A0A6A6VHQ3_9PLEO|nr:hypothetical protein M011DRAFT_398712 [Sporormia fimetaria CBS 119925]